RLRNLFRGGEGWLPSTGPSKSHSCRHQPAVFRGGHRASRTSAERLLEDARDAYPELDFPPSLPVRVPPRTPPNTGSSPSPSSRGQALEGGPVSSRN
ncbi:hypothetical protein B0J11DRAFT_573234, partial [Dendryphion nanum]